MKRDEAQGTWIASHLRWLIRTFWFSFFWGVVGCIVLLVLGIILIGIPIAILIWAVASIWVLYRVIRGYLLFKDEKPIRGCDGSGRRRLSARWRCPAAGVLIDPLHEKVERALRARRAFAVDERDDHEAPAVVVEHVAGDRARRRAFRS